MPTHVSRELELFELLEKRDMDTANVDAAKRRTTEFAISRAAYGDGISKESRTQIAGFLQRQFGFVDERQLARLCRAVRLGLPVTFTPNHDYY